jgi:hypothetical protein
MKSQYIKPRRLFNSKVFLEQSAKPPLVRHSYYFDRSIDQVTVRDNWIDSKKKYLIAFCPVQPMKETCNEQRFIVPFLQERRHPKAFDSI